MKAEINFFLSSKEEEKLHENSVIIINSNSCKINSVSNVDEDIMCNATIEFSSSCDLSTIETVVFNFAEKLKAKSAIIKSITSNKEDNSDYLQKFLYENETPDSIFVKEYAVTIMIYNPERFEFSDFRSWYDNLSIKKEYKDLTLELTKYVNKFYTKENLEKTIEEDVKKFLSRIKADKIMIVDITIYDLKENKIEYSPYITIQI